MVMALRGIPAVSLAAATTGNGTPVTFTSRAQDVHVTVTGTGTISGGTITIQEANSEAYAGTWSTLGTFPAADLTGGAQKVYHFTGIYRAIRVAITAAVTGGGSVSAEILVQ